MAVEKAKNVPPFVLWCTATIPTAFDDSMSYYEALCALYKFIQDNLVEPINNNATVLEQALVAFDELKKYVDEYFDNLDVQEEINNKLDAMVEAGTLDEIINQHIFGELNDKVDANTADIAELEEDLNTVDKKTDFANLKTVQDLFYTPTGSGHSFQGSFVDDNDILYVYNANNAPYGDFNLFNIKTHTYVGSVSNIHLNHGNDFAYKNGEVYVAPVKADDGTLTNKSLLKYNLTSGVISSIAGFDGVSYTYTFGVCWNGDNLIVGLANDSYTPSLNKYVRLDPTNGNFVEYTVNLKKHYIDECQNTAIEVINGKLYLLTSAKSMMYEFEIDDENNVLTLNKVYALGDKDEQGLDFCEFQSITTIPSKEFGEDTFVLTAIDFDNEAHSAISLKVYLSAISSNLNPFLPPNTKNFNPQRIVDVYVKRTGGLLNLLENGSEDYPFTTIHRAIQYANEKHNVVVRDIIVQDSSTYWLGKQVEKKLHIRWDANTPTFKFGEIDSCDLFMRGTAHAVFDKDQMENLRFKHCTGSIGYFDTTSQITIDQGSVMLVTDFDQTVTTTENFNIDRGTVVLNPHNMSGGTNYLVNAQNGSNVQIPAQYAASSVRARYASNIVVASS